MDSIFESISERENSHKLRRQWGDEYRIYPNLNFLNVFKPNTIRKHFSLTDREFDFLKKTDIDYTICDWGDRPLLCIEFDGLQQGFNIGTKYYTANPKNLSRKKNFEMKLKISEKFSIPLFIVGSQHFKNISSHIKLTIVDGVVSHAVAIRKFEDSFKKNAVSTNVFNTFSNPDNLSLHEKNLIVLRYYDHQPPEELCTHKILWKNNPIVHKIREFRKTANESGDLWEMTEKIIPDITPTSVKAKCTIRSLRHFKDYEFIGEVSIPKFGNCKIPDIKNDELNLDWLETLAGINKLEYSFLAKHLSKVLAWNNYVKQLEELSNKSIQ